VTADGGLTVPPAVLDRMAAQARAANRARLAALGTRAAQIDALPEPERDYAKAEFAIALLAPASVESDTQRRMNEATGRLAAGRTPEAPARGGLRLVPPPGPEQPATPCPSWCTVGDCHETGDLYHFSDSEQAGPVAHRLDIDDDGVPNVSIDLGTDPEHLDLDELDKLIEGLTVRRAELAELLAGPYGSPVSQFPAGGAA
jgi:hypothetical protein